MFDNLDLQTDFVLHQRLNYNILKSSVFIRTFIYFALLYMRILGRKIILKIKIKNLGNKKLCDAIDKLIYDLENFDPKKQRLVDIRTDADCVHNEGFYFLDINIHRTLILIEFDDEGEATIVWAGNHKEYETIFKNNKSTIEKWLRKKGYIQ